MTASDANCDRIETISVSGEQVRSSLRDASSRIDVTGDSSDHRSRSCGSFGTADERVSTTPAYSTGGAQPC